MLDPNEWYYDYRSGKLYFAFNGTMPTDEEWIATRTKVLFNITGTQASPVRDVTIAGIHVVVMWMMMRMMMGFD